MAIKDRIKVSPEDPNVYVRRDENDSVMTLSGGGAEPAEGYEIVPKEEALKILAAEQAAEDDARAADDAAWLKAHNAKISAVKEAGANGDIEALSEAVLALH